MIGARRAALDFEIIVNAFDVMGRYLRDQCSLVGEIAVYGGTAMLLQFPWRIMTEDVDVTDNPEPIRLDAASPLTVHFSRPGAILLRGLLFAG